MYDGSDKLTVDLPIFHLVKNSLSTVNLSEPEDLILQPHEELPVSNLVIFSTMSFK
jgi:hypothetical protein